MISMRMRQVTSAVAAGLVLWAGSGCQNGGEEASLPDEQWSTKTQSVLAKDPAMSTLALPQMPGIETVADLRAASVELLLQAADSTNPLLRANAIEALQAEPGRLTPVVRLALADENRGVRFVAAMTVGEMRLNELAHLVEPLLDDGSESVQVAAIYALKRCSRPVDVNPLGRMVMSSDPEVKANSAVVLGKLGESSAIPMLREAVRMDMARWSIARIRIVDLQIAEAMVKLGADKQIEVIRAALYAPDEEGEIAVLACQLCGRLMDEAYVGSLRDMAMRMGRDQKPAEIRLAAAEAVARIRPDMAPVEVVLAYASSEMWELRVQTAMALGQFRDGAVLPTLSAMLNDPNPLVQVASAGALLLVTAESRSESDPNQGLRGG